MHQAKLCFRGARFCQVLAFALAALLGCCVLSSSAIGRVSQEESPSEQKTRDAKHYVAVVRPIFVRHCLECHGTQKPKGDFRLDLLAPDFADDANLAQWQTVAKRVAAGEMPPKRKPRPTEQEVRALTDWIKGRVQTAEAARRAEGRVVLRRLNRIEYENTVRDLLGIEVELRELLPLDGSADGFDNVGAALHTSSFLM